ncbi:MAG TPA: methylenetetrahydrofolate reductase [Acidimicrobiales bacterium]|nr:methylenetetrahydrofolate reductase [Acidimicrobiales bacterium]
MTPAQRTALHAAPWLAGAGAVTGGSGCPKFMVHGPCGGVRPGGGCEVDGVACPFVAAPVTRTARAAPPLPPALTARPLIIADLPVPALDVDALRHAARCMAAAGSVDAALTGDHGRERVQLPPVLRAQILAAEGLAPWIGLNCRDRNRVALEGELAGLAAVGVAGVHCVTGDHTLTGHRPDAAPVFDLDSTELAALAAGRGLTVSVAEAPLAPPVAARPARLAAKAAAGAAVGIVNHTGDAQVVGDFVAAVRAAGATAMTFLACVPVVVSAASAAQLRTFTGLVTPRGLVDRVLAADDPWEAGVTGAVAFARAVLAQAGVDGVDLSGVSGPGEEPLLARAMAEVARRLR